MSKECPWARAYRIVSEIDSPEKAARIIALYSHCEAEFKQVFEEYAPIFSSYRDFNKRDLFKEQWYKNSFQPQKDLAYFLYTHIDDGYINMDSCENGFDID